jgi:hypothetical protein
MRRTWQESAPSIKAALDDVAPDEFVQKFIISKTASADDVAALAKELRRSPAALQTVRGAVAEKLKDAAIGSAKDEVGKFSQKGYNDALDNLRNKLPALFEPEEIAQLQALGRVSSYEMVQPVGAAVNNPNTAAAVTSSALDLLDRIANRTPVVGSTIQGLIRGAQQTDALNTSPMLTQPGGNVPLSTLIRQSPRGAIGLGGMFGLPALPGGEDERR